MTQQTSFIPDLDTIMANTTPILQPVEVIDKPKPAEEKALARSAAPVVLDRTSDGNLITTREFFANMDTLGRMANALSVAVIGDTPDKVKAATASILRGAELGIPPMSAVSMIHFIKGKPSLSADGMVAACRRAGIEFKVEHSKNPGEWCEVQATRGTETYRFRWTIEMAKNAGLGGDNWRKYPWDMLYARAASHVCRKIAPDILGGTYTPDEITEMRDEARAASDDKISKLPEVE